MEIIKSVGDYGLGMPEFDELYFPQEILKEHNYKPYKDVCEAFEEVDRVALVQATGTGKSFIALRWLVDSIEEGENAIFLVPSHAIAEQHKKRIKMLGLADKLKNVKFVLYSSLEAEVDAMLKSSTNVKYIVADEFHRLGAPEWRKAYNTLLLANPDAKVLGLSATPVRYLDGERDMAEELFDITVQGVTLVQGIEKGILKKPTYVRGVLSYQAEFETIEKLKKRIKDKSAQKEIEKQEKDIKRKIQKAQGIEELFGEHMTVKDGKYIVFCSSLDHMEEIKEKIRNGMFGKVNKNVKVYDVSYAKSAKNVDATINEFEKDEGDYLKIMLSIEMFNEGVHVEGIDGAIMMRRTISPRIYFQQLGRVLNVGQDKEPLVIDVVENYESIQTFASYFRQTDGEYGTAGEFEEVLPFEVKGEAVEIDRLMRNLEKFVYSKFGDDYYLESLKEYYLQNGWKGLATFDYSLWKWLNHRKQAYRNNPKDEKLKLVFDELSKIDIFWYEFHNLGNENYQMKMIERARQYYAEHEKSWGNIATVDNSLNSWLYNKQEKYRINPKDEKWGWVFDELSKIDPLWHDDRYNGKQKHALEMIEAARQYYKEKKSWKKLRDYNANLRSWLANKMTQYKKEPNNVRLKWIFDELSKIDSNWNEDRHNGNQKAQLKNIERARQYYTEHEKSWEGLQSNDVNLAAWLFRKKTKYRKKPDDENSAWVFDELSKIDPNWHLNEKERKAKQQVQEEENEIE